MGAKYYAHAAGPDLFNEAVMSENLADAGGWLCHRSGNHDAGKNASIKARRERHSLRTELSSVYPGGVRDSLVPEANGRLTP